MGVFTTQGYRGKLVDKLTGTILDQFADEDIKVSNNVLELFDLGEIPGTYTQQITLPGTKKNNAFFEQYYDISVWEPDIFNTNQVVEAYLDFDSFYLVNGYLQLNKVNVLENKFVDSYEVTLFGIISNFSIDTRSSFLTNITSLSAYNHTSSLANITSSWGGGLFNGDIVYPMIEYGNDATDQPNFYYSNVDFLGIDDFESGVTVSDYKPAIRLKKVWDAIFNEFGYTYTGSFWTQGWLDNVYMPLNNNKQVPIYNPAIDTFQTGKMANISASATQLVANVSQSFPVNAKVYDYNNAFTLTGSSFTFTTTITSRFDVKLNLAFAVTSSSAGSGIPAFYINYMSGSTLVNGQTLARINTYLATIAQSRTSTVTEAFNIKDFIFQTPELDPGTYTFQIYQTPQFYNSYTCNLNPNIDYQSSFEIFRTRQAADYKILDVPSNMPFGTSGIKVIDFIRAIQKKFNLIIYPDKLNPNQFVVETFNNWYKQGQIKDFNKYINIKDKIEFTPANQLGYNKIRFSDAEDSDYVTTLFKRTNNRVYGESNFYDSGSYYSQGTLEVKSDAIGNGPLTLVPGSVYSGDVATVTTCNTYKFTWDLDRGGSTVYYTACDGTPTTASVNRIAPVVYACVKTGQYTLNSPYILVSNQGDCTPVVTGSAATGSDYPVWIPYYIADDKYTPARVLPRLYFYNGLRNTQPYWFEGYHSSANNVDRYQQTKYPYFDNYSTGSLNGSSSLYPQLNSYSLLYNNEEAVWGTTPTGSLVSEYWDKYLELLYNPRTRLVDATAVIPLADYFNIELNDVAEFRGNYYHLRAINDYNLTTGECNIQMLGPIIGDTISYIAGFPSYSERCGFAISSSFTGAPTDSGSLTYVYNKVNNSGSTSESFKILENFVPVYTTNNTATGSLQVYPNDVITVQVSGSQSYPSRVFLRIRDAISGSILFNSNAETSISATVTSSSPVFIGATAYNVTASSTPLVSGSINYDFTAPTIADPTGSSAERYIIKVNGSEVVNLAKPGGNGSLLINKNDKIDVIISGSKYNEPSLRTTYTSSAYLNIYNPISASTVYNTTADGIVTYGFTASGDYNFYYVSASITPHFEIAQYYIGGYIGYFNTSSWVGTVVPARFTAPTSYNKYWGATGVVVGTNASFDTSLSSYYTQLVSASNATYSPGSGSVTAVLQNFANSNSYNTTTESIALYGPWYIGTNNAYVDMQNNRDLMLSRVSGSVFGGYPVPTINETTGAYDPANQYYSVDFYNGGNASINYPKNNANTIWPIRNFGY